MRQAFTLYEPAQRQMVADIVRKLPKFSRVEIKGPVRTISQNSKLWPCLTDIAMRATWQGEKLTELEWKDMFTGAVKVAGGGVRAVPGLEGGIMLLGLHTSDMTVEEAADLITYMLKWGDEHGVEWSDPADRSTSSSTAKAPASPITAREDA
jgi:hypothetical protein